MKWTDTVVHFRIASHSYGDATLCGAKYTEPSAKAAKDGKLCEDCIKVMWKEQHRRNMLMPEIKKARKRLQKNGKVKAKPVGWIDEGDDFFGPVEDTTEAVYLSHYRKEE